MLLPPAVPAVLATLILSSTSPTSNYLPRLLYPGTYGNFCGPTPEVTVPSCPRNGWKGNDPIDRVDAACSNHDLAYCSCEVAWRSRRAAEGREADGTLLSVLVALRGFEWPRAFLQARGVDEQYLACVTKADAALLEKGVSIRSEEQRADCAPASSSSRENSLSWFCTDKEKTLTRFEKVNLAIFLKALDSDRMKTASSSGLLQPPPSPSLEATEARRDRAMREAQSRGEPVSAALSTSEATNAETTLLRILRAAK
jgi:hypothetical protein